MKKLGLIILLLAVIKVFVAAGEKGGTAEIAWFKIESFGFDTYRFHLTDRDGNGDYGYYEIENDIFSSRPLIHDKTESPYNGKVDILDLQRLGSSYLRMRSYSISLLINGILSTTFTGSGIALITLINLKVISFTNRFTEQIVVGLVAALITAGITDLVIMFVYLGLTAYYYSKYKRVRDGVIDKLNGIRVGRNNNLRFKLDLRVSL